MGRCVSVLNESGPQSVIFLGLVPKWLTVWEEIRRLTMLENVSHWIWALWIQQAHARSMSLAFCLLSRECRHKTASFCFSTILSSLWLYTWLSRSLQLNSFFCKSSLGLHSSRAATEAEGEIHCLCILNLQRLIQTL